jgi:hypothetical protein
MGGRKTRGVLLCEVKKKGEKYPGKIPWKNTQGKKMPQTTSARSVRSG